MRSARPGHDRKTPIASTTSVFRDHHTRRAPAAGGGLEDRPIQVSPPVSQPEPDECTAAQGITEGCPAPLPGVERHHAIAARGQQRGLPGYSQGKHETRHELILN